MRFSKDIIVVLFALGARVSMAHDFTYWFNYNYHAPPSFPTSDAMCYDMYKKWNFLSYYDSDNNREISDGDIQCGMKDGSHFADVYRGVIHCSDAQTWDYTNAKCSSVNSRGRPDTMFTCGSPSLVVGDPIDIRTGNSFQSVTDIQVDPESIIYLSRYYNSSDGLWRHSWSAGIQILPDALILTVADGGVSIFTSVGDGRFESPTELGYILQENSGYTYYSQDRSVYTFSSSGGLMSITDASGRKVTVASVYNEAGAKISLVDDQGNTATLLEDQFHQPLQFTLASTSLTYTYSSTGQLTQVSKKFQGHTSDSHYFYEDSVSGKLLTSTVDERGVSSASWAYDSQGRVVSSALAGGAGSVMISYNDTDGSRVVTNSLGKSATYHFSNYQGLGRITSIAGQLSPNCSASNSSYTYNDQGQVLTKTDAKGNLTTYTYNDRGLEASRTEASGTPQARTITTSWDPTRFLRSQVVEPNRTTVYSYDDQGRLLNTQVTAR